MFRRLIGLLVAVAMFPSCMDCLSETCDEKKDTYRITVRVDEPYSALSSKSSFTEEEVGRITDLNVFIYHDGKLLEKYSRYFDDLSSLMLSYPYGGEVFNIYMLGNVGKVKAPELETEIGSVCSVARSYGEFREKGFPVAGTFLDFRKGSFAEFRLKRLIGQYNVRMRTSAEQASYVVKDVRLRNCALDVYPFSTEETPASVFAPMREGREGDALTSDDVAELNAGKTVSMFFVENLQGVLLPDNTDRKKKIPSQIDALYQGVSDHCTYMEITADIMTPSAIYTDAKFRFYLGQDETSDFNVRRNTLYDVTLDFTQNVVCEEEWRIEVNAPDILEVALDKEEAMVIKGVEDMVFVKAYGNEGRLMDFDVQIMSSNKYIDVEKIQTNWQGENVIGLRFLSNVDLCGLYSFESEPEYKTETVRLTSKETYNGRPLFTRDIKVRIYDRMFPLLIKLQKNSASDGLYSVILRGQNPMGLGFSLACSYRNAGKTYSKSAISRCNNYQDGELYADAVNMDGKVFGEINVKPSELARIDFSIRGLARISSGEMAYPKFLTTTEICMGGPESKAVYGPDADQYPACFPDMPDDSKYYMRQEYNADAFWHISYDTDDNDYTAESVVDRFRSSLAMNPDLLPDPGRTDWEKYYFYAACWGIHAKSYDEHAHFYNDYSKYENCPFYFKNGGLIADYTRIGFAGKIVRYTKKSWRGFCYGFYGPGRDLFMENRNGDVVGRYHEMAYWITTWKPMIGSRINSHQEEKYYDAGLYMTINGASAWCGNDITESGYFLDN